MLTLMTGNILDSDAECLVNTVNCEGFMGKGLAYQFKNMFPETNKAYVTACKYNKLHPGELHYYDENGKLIINFPTKDKWREKSKHIYIDEGMKALVKLIKEKNIKSIAIPPLGSGNGGLNWEEVKKTILEYTLPMSTSKDIYIYEPSLCYKSEIKKAPKLTMSHLILMIIKQDLISFSKFRLQKTAFFINIFSNQAYFKFLPHHYGPYSHSIEILSRNIKEFQQYHKFTTAEAIQYTEQTLMSTKLKKELLNFSSSIEKAITLINSYSSNEDIELLSTISFIILNNPNIIGKDIVAQIHLWSDLKKNKFSEQEIFTKIDILLALGILQKNILGEYCIKI